MYSWHIHTYDQIDSTMDQAARLLQSGLEAQTRHAVVANIQTAGRGKYERVWVSDIGNLYTTLLIQPPQPLHKWSELTFVASLGLHQAVHNLLNNYDIIAPPLQLKWPNDILIDHQKVAGLLLEIITDVQGTSWLAIGLGINVAYAPDQLEATFLHFYLPRLSVQDVLAKVLTCFDALSVSVKNIY